MKTLERAIEKARSLPKNEQEGFGEFMLAELQDSHDWDQQFARSIPQLNKLAKQAVNAHEQGKTSALDFSKS